MNMFRFVYEKDQDRRQNHVRLTFNHSENVRNRFNNSEDHKIDTKIIKIGALVIDQ